MEVTLGQKVRSLLDEIAVLAGALVQVGIVLATPWAWSDEDDDEEDRE